MRECGAEASQDDACHVGRDRTCRGCDLRLLALCPELDRKSPQHQCNTPILAIVLLVCRQHTERLGRLPPSGLKAWLCERRPVFAREKAKAPEQDAGAPWHKLLRVVYGGAAHEVTQVVCGITYLLTIITARAEAWIEAWEHRRSWGGSARVPVGRRLNGGELVSGDTTN